ncbi:hypothetical protein ASJ81_05645 [Methanosarcina spelaei]|uniref:DUF1673 domain-containing protein n=1 Tax=Methanosarcina spelaei TaxID=1036679 RepID=A0A2A2HT65_9EURY|nr:DUF1673 domain-containing protein [Methanosarcina spelaei]PAV12689.1 hypothetical protein ASJ81_05645 [Methanosarcina spelaei]
MNLFTKNINGLVSWCSNSRLSEVRQHIHLEIFGLNIPNRAKGERENMKNLRWFRKASTRTFLVNFFFTIIFSLIMAYFGANIIFLLAGFLIALFSTLFYWNTQMQRYDALVKQPSIDHPNMKVLFIIITAALMLTPYYYFQELTLQSMTQSMFSFVGGLLISMWLNYFQLIYWEKKNRRIIYFDKSYGTWKKSYIVLEKK